MDASTQPEKASHVGAANGSTVAEPSSTYAGQSNFAPPNYQAATQDRQAVPTESPAPALNAAFTPAQAPVQMVPAVPLTALGEYPAVIDCPYCHRRAQTRVEGHDSGMTICAGIGLGLLCICLACLPCMMHWMQDYDHYCTQCNSRVVHIPNGGMPQIISPPSQAVPQQYQMGNVQPYNNNYPSQQGPK